MILFWPTRAGTAGEKSTRMQARTCCCRCRLRRTELKLPKLIEEI